MVHGNWVDKVTGRLLEESAKEAGVPSAKVKELIEMYFEYIRICMASYYFPVIQILNFGKLRPYYYKLVNRFKTLDKRKFQGLEFTEENQVEWEALKETVDRIEREKTKRRHTKLYKLKKDE